MLPSGKQVLCVTIFILRMFFKPNPNCCAFRFLIIFCAWRSLSENITAMHLGFSNFMHGNISENPTAVHLGLSNFMQGCRACRHIGFFSKLWKTQPSSSPLLAFQVKKVTFTDRKSAATLSLKEADNFGCQRFNAFLNVSIKS